MRALEQPVFSVECGYASSCPDNNIDSIIKIEDSKPESPPDAPEHAPAPSEPVQEKNAEQPALESLKLELRQRLARLQELDNENPIPHVAAAEPPRDSFSVTPGQEQASPPPNEPNPPPSSNPGPKTAGTRPNTGTEPSSNPEEESSSSSDDTPIDPEVLPPGRYKVFFVIPKGRRSPYFEMCLENRKYRPEHSRVHLDNGLYQDGRNNIAGSIGILVGACTTVVVHDEYGYTLGSAVRTSLAGFASFVLGSVLRSKFPALGRGFQNAGIGMVAMDGFKRLHRHLTSTESDKTETSVSTNQQASQGQKTDSGHGQEDTSGGGDTGEGDGDDQLFDPYGGWGGAIIEGELPPPDKRNAKIEQLVDTVFSLVNHQAMSAQFPPPLHQYNPNLGSDLAFWVEVSLRRHYWLPPGRLDPAVKSHRPWIELWFFVMDMTKRAEGDYYENFYDVLDDEFADIMNTHPY